MPKIIKQGAVVDAGTETILALDDWLALEDKSHSAVVLQPDQPPAPLLDNLGDLQLIAIAFPNFMDGRGFSYARELRERGYTGELRASGSFIRDQLHYLARCGFDAFAFDDDSNLEAACASLSDFDEHYQAAIDQPLPLFRRRA
jgi:uncharacterized protein (DUF934 family)